MDMMQEFLSKISENLEKKNISRNKKEVIIEVVKEKYKDSPIFFDVESDIEDEEIDSTEIITNDNIETPSDDKFQSIMGQMNLIEAGEDSKEIESREERIKYWQEYYKDKNVFPSEDMISTEEIDNRGDFGRTALHNAVLQNDTDNIKELVQQGADVTIKDNSGNTPYRLALLEDCEDAIKALEELGVTK
ncbi:MAG: ankyrin repeat domain-containing protein [Elusimicrobiota bacterium]